VSVPISLLNHNSQLAENFVAGDFVGGFQLHVLNDIGVAAIRIPKSRRLHLLTRVEKKPS
jgi:hypothetical protein